MPKDNRIKQQHMRSRIAAAAARIMAEDGIEDFALAKRKAARQLGADATHALPDNAEVMKVVRQSWRRVSAMKLDDLKPAVLHEYLDQVQADLCSIHDTMARQYFHLHQ